MKDVVIKGIGAYTPSQIISNDDLSKIVNTNDQWIRERTGIKERRVSQGEDTSSIATKACEKALQSAGVDATEIDLIIVATVTPDMFTPSVACMVQSNLGAVNATAFDINAACSGFIYGLQVAESMMKNLGYNKALVIGAETLSKIVDWNDRSTCVLFGDGGGACVLSLEEEKEGIITSFTASDGAKGDCLQAGAFDVINPYVEEVVEKSKTLSMDGRAVFRFATSVIVDAIKKVLNNSKYSIDDVKYIIPHQANVRIIEYAAKKLEVENSKFFVNLDRFGNTSSASIPIALDELYSSKKLQKGDLVILVGFGGGLTYGATLVRL